MSDWCCPNCGTGTTYFSPDNPTAKSCFCTFKGEIVDAERERIKQLLWDDGYLYEMERDHVWSLIEGEE